MLLAGNAPPVTPNTTSTTSLIQTIPKSPSLDAFVNVNKCHGTSPRCPIPITSRGTSQSIGVFKHNANDTTIIRSIGVLKSPSNTAELSKIITSQESRPPSHNLSAVPQARKASLTRFLETLRRAPPELLGVVGWGLTWTILVFFVVDWLVSPEKLNEAMEYEQSVS